MSAIYVYDIRTQMSEPAFVVYDESHVDKVMSVLFETNEKEHMFVTKSPVHRVYPIDPYKTNKPKRRW